MRFINVLFHDVSAQAAFYDLAVERKIAVNFAIEFHGIIAFNVNLVANEMPGNIQIHMLALDELRQNFHDLAVGGQ